jgi:hypothetical protein
MKLAFVTIASGSYRSFIPPLIQSSKQFVKGCDAINWLVLGDRCPSGGTFSFGRVPGREWPYSTLMRFHDMLAYRETLAGADYIVYVDADMRFVDEVDVSEWNGTYVVVQHPGYLQSDAGPFERRAESKAAVNPEYRGPYIQGCLFGGDAISFWKLCETLRTQVEHDLTCGIMAKWHDESHLNAYFSRAEAKVLDSGYAYPEGWELNLKPHILHLKKNHDLIRSKGFKKILIFLNQVVRSGKHVLKRVWKVIDSAF